MPQSVHDLPKPLSRSSGQVLLIGAGTLAVLLISCVMFFILMQQGIRHQYASSHNSKAQGVAEEGIVDAIQQLSVSTTAWQNALGANFANTGCNAGNRTGASGATYRLFCSTGTAGNPKLQIYEVAVRAVAYDPKGKPLRAQRAYLSQRTLGSDPTPGVHAGVALQLMRQPSPGIIQGNLDVHWGPIVCLDSTRSDAWVLPTPMDAGRYPRKFSAGGITGSANARAGSTSGSVLATDQKEYWANASQDYPSVIDEESYKLRASVTDILDAPKNAAGVDIPRSVHCAAGHTATCAIFTPNAGDTAIFDKNGLGYSVPAGTVIYVEGPAQFDRIAIDQATFIIDGDLTAASTVGGNPMPLHVPATAPLEYPYSPASTSWPCRGQQGNVTSSGAPKYDCSHSQVFSGHVYFRGFLYVKGNMTVTVPDWNMVGSLLVGDINELSGTGGQLRILPGAGLVLAYDDVINHELLVNSVLASSIKIVPDTLEDIPAF